MRGVLLTTLLACFQDLIDENDALSDRVERLEQLTVSLRHAVDIATEAQGATAVALAEEEQDSSGEEEEEEEELVA